MLPTNAPAVTYQRPSRCLDQSATTPRIARTTRWLRLRSVFRAIWPPLLFLLCSLWVFRQSIFEGRIYFQNDTMMFYYPIASVIDAAIDRGRVPLWTPYIFGGHPLLADGEAGIFYPFNFVAYWLMPAAQTIGWLRLLRFFLAALFTFFFARALRLDRVPSTIAALAFAFGSYMIGQLHHTNVGDTSIWLPLLLAGIEMALRHPRYRPLYLALSAAALGMASLTVHANPLALMLTLAALYVSFRVFACPDFAAMSHLARLKRAALVLAIPLITGLALGAAQLLPLWELSSFSRGRGVSYEFATGFAMPPANAITLLFPYFFRDAAGGYWSPWFRWSTIAYVGIAPLLLAGIALLRRPSRLAIFFAAIALSGLLLAFGDYSPLKLYGFVWQLPVFSWLRGPERFLYWTTFALAMLAGMGAQALFDPSRRGAPGLRRYLAALTLAVPLIAGLLFGARRLIDMAPQETKDLLKANYLSLRGSGLELNLSREPFEGLRHSLDIASPWTSRGLLWLAVAVALFWLCYHYRAAAPLWKVAMVALVAVDLLGFATVFHPTVPIQKIQMAGPVAEFLQQRGGTHRVLTLWPAFDTWPDRLLPLRISEAGGYSSLVTSRHETFLSKAGEGSRQLLDLMNVKYMVAIKGREPSWLQGQQPAVQEGALAVYERTGSLPRAFLVPEAAVGTKAEVLAAITDKSFQPDRKVWLEVPDRAEIAKGEPGGQAGDVQIANYSAESVTLDVQARRQSFLVFGDTYYPGWNAYVDGETTPIYRADYIFRAIALPPGKHTVRFAFEPGSVWLGEAISLAAAAGVLTVLAVSIRRRRTFVT